MKLHKGYSLVITLILREMVFDEVHFRFDDGISQGKIRAANRKLNRGNEVGHKFK